MSCALFAEAMVRKARVEVDIAHSGIELILDCVLVYPVYLRYTVIESFPQRFAEIRRRCAH